MPDVPYCLSWCFQERGELRGKEDEKSECREHRKLQRKVTAGGASWWQILLLIVVIQRNSPAKCSLPEAVLELWISTKSSAMCTICTHKVANVWIVFGWTVLEKSGQLDSPEAWYSREFSVFAFGA